MKKYSHAWLALMAIKRLKEKKDQLSKVDQVYADDLIWWFQSYNDCVIEGAWYPDTLIKKNDSEHVLKFVPFDQAKPGTKSIPPENRRKLPSKYLILKHGSESLVKQKAFNVADPNDNLPDRCESLAHAVIDQLKVQEHQNKGSPVSPTDNQVALWLFMLSHYVADAHVPVHCDNRKFPKGEDIHALMEEAWEDEVKNYFSIDKKNCRFKYDEDGYPALTKVEKNLAAYPGSILKAVDVELAGREFNKNFGENNSKVWDFVDAICHHSYLLSYRFLPEGTKTEEIDEIKEDKWKRLAQPPLSFKDFSVAVLSDAIDSIARVWFRTWRRYDKWSRKREEKKDEEDEEAPDTDDDE